MIAEFAHFYLFGFICVTSGNTARRSRSRFSSFPLSLPQLGPSAPPAPSFALERSSASTLRAPGPRFPRELPPAVGAAREKGMPGSGGCAGAGDARSRLLPRSGAPAPGLPLRAAPGGRLMGARLVWSPWSRGRWPCPGYPPPGRPGRIPSPGGEGRAWGWVSLHLGH